MKKPKLHALSHWIEIIMQLGALLHYCTGGFEKAHGRRTKNHSERTDFKHGKERTCLVRDTRERGVDSNITFREERKRRRLMGETEGGLHAFLGVHMPRVIGMPLDVSFRPVPQHPPAAAPPAT